MKVKAERAIWAMDRAGGEWRELMAYYDEQREKDIATAARGSNASQAAVLIDDDAQEIETKSRRKQSRAFAAAVPTAEEDRREIRAKRDGTAPAPTDKVSVYIALAGDTPPEISDTKKV